jgi:hypothetical protein
MSQVRRAFQVGAVLAVLVGGSFLYDALKPSESQLDVDCGTHVGVVSLTKAGDPASAVVLLASGRCMEGFAEVCPDAFWVDVFGLMMWLQGEGGDVSSLLPNDFRGMIASACCVCSGRAAALSPDFMKFVADLS